MGRQRIFLISETRYGGTYEGGPWAAFLVDPKDDGRYELPEEAFSGDVDAADWWWGGQSVPVAAGDTPSAALENLRWKLDFPDVPRFKAGDSVVINGAPDFWHYEGVGTITGSVQEPRLGTFAPPGATEWEYEIEFPDGARRKVPEPYLRPFSA